MKKIAIVIAALVTLFAASAVDARSLTDWIDANCEDCTARMATQTGAYILEKGEESLVGRAWLGQHATESIDIQYFIWSTDNVGIIAAEQLLSAAERGVRVRVQPSSAADWWVVQEDDIMHLELEECAQGAARAGPVHQESQRGDRLDDGERPVAVVRSADRRMPGVEVRTDQDDLVG